MEKTRFIVMTAAAQMPSSCWGRYRRVAVLETTLPQGASPKMISDRAKGVKRIVATWEKCNVGTTRHCAYRQALAEAESMADRLNAGK